ncbi:histidinol-phosphate transaminase [Corynebacterium sp. Q4381]|uniref:histidinol-phosphate transaminase n=1 Tax=Corynebacterium sp. Marseille-Q4381 TaxID=3121597 RepID=UPI002FE62A8C
MIRPDLDTLPAYVPGVRNARAVKLSSNECAEAPLPSVIDAMQASLAGVNRYPDMGAVELREALARHLGVGAYQVAVGTGSSALCQQLVVATSGPGDEVVFPWRSFEAYPIFAQIAGAAPVAVPLTANHRVDLAAMADAVTERTRMVFVCNPNNPTGTTITNDEFDEFMNRVPEAVLVALDEAYFEYNTASDGPIATEAITRYPNVIGLRTFSKAYGLAGARVGYAFGPRHLIEALNKVAVPFSVSSVAQAGAIASLEAQDELRERVHQTVAQRKRVTDELGIDESQANFIWLPGAAQEVADQLAQGGVLVRVFPEGIRVTVTNEAETDAFLKAYGRA